MISLSMKCFVSRYYCLEVHEMRERKNFYSLFMPCGSDVACLCFSVVTPFVWFRADLLREQGPQFYIDSRLQRCECRQLRCAGGARRPSARVPFSRWGRSELGEAVWKLTQTNCLYLSRPAYSCSCWRFEGQAVHSISSSETSCCSCRLKYPLFHFCFVEGCVNSFLLLWLKLYCWFKCYCTISLLHWRACFFIYVHRRPMERSESHFSMLHRR